MSAKIHFDHPRACTRRFDYASTPSLGFVTCLDCLKRFRCRGCGVLTTRQELLAPLCCGCSNIEFDRAVAAQTSKATLS
jgi:hypothetical protein